MTVMSVIYKEIRCVYVYSGPVTNCVIIDIDIDIDIDMAVSTQLLVIGEDKTDDRDDVISHCITLYGMV